MIRRGEGRVSNMIGDGAGGLEQRSSLTQAIDFVFSVLRCSRLTHNNKNVLSFFLSLICLRISGTA